MGYLLKRLNAFKVTCFFLWPMLKHTIHGSYGYTSFHSRSNKNGQAPPQKKNRFRFPRPVSAFLPSFGERCTFRANVPRQQSNKPRKRRRQNPEVDLPRRPDRSGEVDRPKSFNNENERMTNDNRKTRL